MSRLNNEVVYKLCENYNLINLWHRRGIKSIRFVRWWNDFVWCSCSVTMWITGFNEFDVESFMHLQFCIAYSFEYVAGVRFLIHGKCSRSNNRIQSKHADLLDRTNKRTNIDEMALNFAWAEINSLKAICPFAFTSPISPKTTKWYRSASKPIQKWCTRNITQIN